MRKQEAYLEKCSAYKKIRFITFSPQRDIALIIGTSNKVKYTNTDDLKFY